MGTNLVDIMHYCISSHLPPLDGVGPSDMIDIALQYCLNVQINKQTNKQSIYYVFRGRLKSVKYANTQPMCVDHLQRDEAHKLKPYILGQYQCHTFVGNSQYFTFSKG